MPRKQLSRCVKIAFRGCKLSTASFERKLSAKATAVRKLTTSASYGPSSTVDGLNGKTKASAPTLERTASSVLPFAARPYLARHARPALQFLVPSLRASQLHSLAPGPYFPSFAASPCTAEKEASRRSTEKNTPLATPFANSTPQKDGHNQAGSTEGGAKSPLGRYAKLGVAETRDGASAMGRREANRALKAYADLGQAQQKRTIVMKRRMGGSKKLRA